jgi:hypothetical protein
METSDFEGFTAGSEQYELGLFDDYDEPPRPPPLRPRGIKPSVLIISSRNIISNKRLRINLFTTGFPNVTHTSTPCFIAMAGAIMRLPVAQPVAAKLRCAPQYSGAGIVSVAATPDSTSPSRLNEVDLSRVESSHLA